MLVLAATSYRITDLGTLAGGSQSVAHGLNALGWVVGTADTGSGDFHAFLSTGGPLLDLGTLGGKTSTATRPRLHWPMRSPPAIPRVEKFGA